MLSEVEPVRVPGRQTHDPRPGPADPDRGARPLDRLRRADRVVNPVVLSDVGRAVLLPEPPCDLEAIAKLLHAVAGRGKVVPVGPVLVLFPSRADPKLEPAVGHVIDTRCHLRLESRVAELNCRDEDAEADLRRVSCERGEEGPRLEAVAVRGPPQAAEEMVAHPERVEARFLRALREVADLRVRPSGRGRDDDSKLHGPMLRFIAVIGVLLTRSRPVFSPMGSAFTK